MGSLTLSFAIYLLFAIAYLQDAVASDFIEDYLRLIQDECYVDNYTRSTADSAISCATACAGTRTCNGFLINGTVCGLLSYCPNAVECRGNSGGGNTKGNLYCPEGKNY